MAARDEVKRAKEIHKKSIMKKPNVVGVGVGYKISHGRKTDELAVVALVREKLPPAGLPSEALIPSSVDHIPTDVVEVGIIRALQGHTDRWRPAPGGISIGHYQITAGTFGTVVRDRATGDRLILSNNHVLANSNTAKVGDPILQPGAADGGQISTDTIGHLERFWPIDFGTDTGSCSLANAYAEIGNAIAQLLGSSHRVQVFQANAQAINQIDAALARPVNDSDILDEIFEIGEVSGVIEAELGMAVRKSGRTTGFTTGEIMVLEATVSVDYGISRKATFEGQIITGPMSQGGDSGSLLVARNSLSAVGLLFAGSAQTTVYNPIKVVFDTLEIEL